MMSRHISTYHFINPEFIISIYHILSILLKLTVKHIFVPWFDFVYFFIFVFCASIFITDAT
jgi:hypothetical protein